MFIARSLNSEERERALLVYKHFVPTALFPTDSGAGDSLVTRMVVHSFRDGESNVPYEKVLAFISVARSAG